MGEEFREDVTLQRLCSVCLLCLHNLIKSYKYMISLFVKLCLRCFLWYAFHIYAMGSLWVIQRRVRCVDMDAELYNYD